MSTPHLKATAPFVMAALLLAGCSDAVQSPAAPPATTGTTIQETAAPGASGPEQLPTRARIPAGPAHFSVVDLLGGEVGRLVVSGETVPGLWMLRGSSGDVWVADKVAVDERKSMWWGKGTVRHRMPRSAGSMLPGGVVISPDSRWIAWTRPAGDLEDPVRPNVVEVVETASGKARWSRRTTGGEGTEPVLMAVTGDGVVVFAHCTEPALDREGWPRCDAARVVGWAPEVDITSPVPAGVVVEPAAGPQSSPRPLVQATGAQNGLLVHRKPTGPARYVRVSARGEVDVVAVLPSRTVAVTADESHAVVERHCEQAPQTCRWYAVPLDGGEWRLLRGVRGARAYEDARAMLFEGFASFVPERDDLVVVQSRLESGLAPIVARCSLVQARCIRTKG